jgi:DivIVA domain-containing protein
MDQDDPEKRIAELERQLAEHQRAAGDPGASLWSQQGVFPPPPRAGFPPPPTGPSALTTGGWLTPEHVRNVSFSKPPIGARGYNEAEVDAFLDLVEQQMQSRQGALPPPPQAAFPPPQAWFPPAPGGRQPATSAAGAESGGGRIARVVLRWVYGLLLLLLAAAALGALKGLLRSGLPHLFPALNSPAPDWVGLLFLAVPAVLVLVYMWRWLRRHR